MHMKLYTKTGDGGETGLFGGIRVSKDDPRVAAYGDVDETNAAIGVAAATSKDAELIGRLREIQSDMFALGARLATLKSSGPGPGIDGEAVRRLEGWIDEADAEVKPLESFVLPGGTASAAALHLARTVCRRAERSVVALARASNVEPDCIIYLNRLSDLLFALARAANGRAKVADVPWTGKPR